MSVIRRAGVADAEVIAGIDVRAWWHGYSGFLDEQRLSERSVDERTVSWSEHLGAAAPGETWVLAVADRIAGYVSVGPARDPDLGTSSGELYALYVDPPAQGAGAGTQLLAHSRRRLGELGFGEAVLWTFTENGLARTFYEQQGWELDPSGARNEGCESWAPAVRYRRALATEA